MNLENARAARLSAIFAVALVFALSTSSAALAQQAGDAENWERCYGVALAGQNDGLATGAAEFIPGSSQSDYQGDAWVLVPKGECETTETPAGTGSLTPQG